MENQRAPAGQTPAPSEEPPASSSLLRPLLPEEADSFSTRVTDLELEDLAAVRAAMPIDLSCPSRAVRCAFAAPGKLSLFACLGDLPLGTLAGCTTLASTRLGRGTCRRAPRIEAKARSKISDVIRRAEDSAPSTSFDAQVGPISPSHLPLTNAEEARATAFAKVLVGGDFTSLPRLSAALRGTPAPRHLRKKLWVRPVSIAFS